MSKRVTMIKTIHEIPIILVMLISGFLLLSPVIAGEDPDLSPGSSTASSTPSLLIPALILICALGAIVGVRGLSDKKENEKWYYLILIAVSILCIYFIYEVFYTFRL